MERLKRSSVVLLALIMALMMSTSVLTVYGADDPADPVTVEWGLDDFTFDDAGTTITGLTDAGKEKLKVDPALVLPDTNADGDNIIGIGAGITGMNKYNKDNKKPGIGTFGFVENNVSYVPTTVKLPKKLESIGDLAFCAAYNTNGDQLGLTKIDLPVSLKTIGKMAFNAAPIRKVSLPTNLESLGQGAFASVAKAGVKLQQISFPTTVKYEAIPNMLANNQSVTKVNVPNGIKSIGTSAFAYCGVTELTLPDGLESVGGNAFASSSLEEINLPASVTSVNASAFSGNTVNDEAVNVKVRVKDDDQYAALSTVAGSGHEYVKYATVTFDPGTGSLPEGQAASVKVNDAKTLDAAPDAVPADDTTVFLGWALKASGKNMIDADTQFDTDTTVYAVYGTSEWTTDDFVISSNTIEGFSAAGLGKVKVNGNVIMPSENSLGDNITIIGANAFADCSGITSVTLPENLRTVSESAFRGCSISNIVLPDTVTNVNDGAFASQTGLASITLSAKLTKIGEGAFVNNASGISVKEIVIPDTVTAIGDSAFAGLHVEQLTLGKKVKTIGAQAFMNHSLTELTIPASVVSIGDSAFDTRGKDVIGTLTTLVLNEGLESIDAKAFGNTQLESVDLPKTVLSLDEKAFYGYTKKTTTAEGGKVILNAGSAMQAKPNMLIRIAVEGLGHTVVHPAVDVENLIAAIPEDVTTDDGKAAIETAATAYEALSDENKAEVSNYATLEAAQKVVAAAEAQAAAEEAQAAAEEAQKAAEEKAAAAEEAQKAAEEKATAAEAAQKTAEEKAAAAEAAQKAAEEAAAKADEASKNSGEREGALAALANSVVAASDLDTSKYTSNTAAAYSKALSAAKAVLTKAGASKDEIDAANDALAKAKAALTSKSSQSLSVSNVKRTLKAKALKKKAKTVKGLKVSGAKTALTYKKISVNKAASKFVVNSKTGKIKVKKGTKKGTYKVKIQVDAAGDGNYFAASKTAVVKVKVK